MEKETIKTMKGSTKRYIIMHKEEETATEIAEAK